MSQIDFSKLGDFEIHLRVLGLRPKTIESYMQSLVGFKKNVNVENAETWLESCFQYLAAKKFTSSTINVKLAAAKGFIRFLNEIDGSNYLISKDFSTPKVARRIPEILTEVEIRKILDEATSLDIVFHTIIEMLYSTGARISEVLELEIGQVMDQHQKIRTEIIVKGKGGKERILFLNLNTRGSLKRLLKDRKIEGKEPIFASSHRTKEGKLAPLSRQRVFQVLKNLAIRAGIDPNRLSPHKIRHSIAVHLLNGTRNNGEGIQTDIRLIQEFLGHKSIKTTQIYLNHAKLEDLRSMIRDFHPLTEF